SLFHPFLIGVLCLCFEEGNRLSESNSNSRANRHLKKQKQKKRIVFLIGLGALFCVFLITWITVVNKESKKEPQKNETALIINMKQYIIEQSRENKRKILKIRELVKELVKVNPIKVIVKKRINVNDINLKESKVGNM